MTELNLLTSGVWSACFAAYAGFGVLENKQKCVSFKVSSYFRTVVCRQYILQVHTTQNSTIVLLQYFTIYSTTTYYMQVLNTTCRYYILHVGTKYYMQVLHTTCRYYIPQLQYKGTGWLASFFSAHPPFHLMHRENMV